MGKTTTYNNLLCFQGDNDPDCVRCRRDDTCLSCVTKDFDFSRSYQFPEWPRDEKRGAAMLELHLQKQRNPKPERQQMGTEEDI